VSDVDSAFKRAVDAGAKALSEPADMFWGDRFGKLVDLRSRPEPI
jgi:PhnB protein